MISNTDFEVATTLTNLCKKETQLTKSSSLTVQQCTNREFNVPKKTLNLGGSSHHNIRESIFLSPSNSRNSQTMRFSESEKYSKRSDAKFPMRLMQVLDNEEYDNIMTWTENGNAFLIKDRDAFVRSVLYSHFKGLKYDSFIRKLYRWGFRKIHSGKNQDAFYNKNVKSRYYGHCTSLARKASRSQSQGLESTSTELSIERNLYLATNTRSTGVHVSDTISPLIEPRDHLKSVPIEWSQSKSPYDKTQPLSSRTIRSVMKANRCLLDATLNSENSLIASTRHPEIGSSHAFHKISRQDVIMQNAFDALEHDKIQRELLHFKKIRNELLQLERKEQLVDLKEKQFQREQQKIKAVLGLRSARTALEAKKLFWF